MITTPLDELRVHLEREERLQRGLAAARRRDLLQEVQTGDAADRSNLVAAVWQALAKMLHRHRARLRTQPGSAFGSKQQLP